jgi:hypothetical protein
MRWNIIVECDRFQSADALLDLTALGSWAMLGKAKPIANPDAEQPNGQAL